MNKQSETVEQVAARIIDDCWVTNDWGNCAIDYALFATKLLSDPAVLELVPGVKELREELRIQDQANEILTRRIASLEQQLAEEIRISNERAEYIEKRWDAENAQLAEGGEAVAWQYWSNLKWNDCAKDFYDRVIAGEEDYAHFKVRQLYTRPQAQPSIGKTAAEYFGCDDSELHVCHECEGYGVRP